MKMVSFVISRFFELLVIISTSTIFFFKPNSTHFPSKSCYNPNPNTFFTPNSPNFSLILNKTARNLRCITPMSPKPQLIFTPLNEIHIQMAVMCAKKLGIQIRVRSGGHDYEGMSYSSAMDLPFIVIP